MHLFPPLSREMTSSMLGPLFPALSRRELEVLLCLARGQSNKQIAETLFISIETVETHVSRITKRYRWGSRNVAQVEVYDAFILQARGERR